MWYLTLIKKMILHCFIPLFSIELVSSSTFLFQKARQHSPPIKGTFNIDFANHSSIILRVWYWSCLLITNRKQKMAVHGSQKSLSRATSLKEEGNKNFRQGNLKTAVDYYTQVKWISWCQYKYKWLTGSVLCSIS